MPKKSNSKEDTQIQKSMSNLGVTLGEQLKAHPSDKLNLYGKIISINLAKQTMFGVGNIWLTESNYWAKIPSNLTDQEYKIISKALEIGTIVFGKTYLPAIEKDNSVREKYSKALSKVQEVSIPKEVRDMFSKLVKDKEDNGWTPYEIANYCSAQERSGRARPVVLNLLEEVKALYDGPKEIFSKPVDDKEGIKNCNIQDYTDPMEGLVLDEPK